MAMQSTHMLLVSSVVAASVVVESVTATLSLPLVSVVVPGVSVVVGSVVVVVGSGVLVGPAELLLELPSLAVTWLLSGQAVRRRAVPARKESERKREVMRA
jgi:hypothetical protein